MFILISIVGVLAYIVIYDISKMKKRGEFDVIKLLKRLLLISSVQILWTIPYLFWAYLFWAYLSNITLFGIYLSDTLLFWVSCLVIIGITIIIMYRWQKDIIYWLVTNVIVLLSISVIWFNIDATFFKPIMSALGMLPLFVIIFIHGAIQMMIWLLIKLDNWINWGKKQDKAPLRQVVINVSIITIFQMLLSILLGSVFAFKNSLLSDIAIFLVLVFIFGVRKKIGGNYLFWLLSWLVISFVVIKIISFHHFSFPYEIRERRLNIGIISIIGVAIYHLALTVYFKLKTVEDDT